jgi:V8-like Glu-specific endopeptidase
MQRLFVILRQNCSMRKLVATSLMVVAVLFGSAGCQTTPKNGYHENVKFTNGIVYSGYFLNNKANGKGTATYANGTKYVGEWRNSKPHGQGTATLANGDKYVGEWRDGKRNGQGTFTFANEGKYVGEWRDDKPYGKGTETFPNGKKYVGEWMNGKRHGQGTATYANGTKYVGEWRDGKPHGQGTVIEIFPSGDKYVGEVRDGKRHGQGTMTFINGNKYVGEWRNTKYNGQGTYTKANGDKYVGAFRDGKPYGQGTSIFADGRIQEGIWKDGKFQYAQKGSSPPSRVVEKGNERRPSTKSSPPPKSGSTGSGFFVSKLGHVVTNAHVVRNCGSITVGDNAKKQVATILLETDKRNDLALLKISSTQMASADTKSLIRKLGLKLVPTASEGLLRSDDVELGEDVLVSGYPYGDIYSNTIKVTKGIVSANRGLGDDRGQFQMDAAVQPGNSGGPIYDGKGNIVGVVVAQLNKLKFAKAIGSLPENVNFGIKASTVRQFLTSSGLPTKWSQRSHSMSTKELAKIAKNQTVMVVCNR